MLHALRRARIADAIRQTLGNAQPPLDFAKRQQATARGKQCAVEPCLDRPAAIGDRPGRIGITSSLADMRVRHQMGLGLNTQILHQIAGLSPCPPTLAHNPG